MLQKKIQAYYLKLVKKCVYFPKNYFFYFSKLKI